MQVLKAAAVQSNAIQCNPMKRKQNELKLKIDTKKEDGTKKRIYKMVITTIIVIM